MSQRWKHPGWIGAAVYAVAAALVGGVITVISRLQVAKQRGRRRVAQSLPAGGVIIISNHTSYVDGILLALVCRKLGRSVRLLATSGVFKAPVLGRLVRRLGFIPVDRGASTAAHSLDAAAAALEAGEAVGIFPEGRLTRDPDNWPERAKTGSVRLALRTGAPIVPVAMVGAHRVLSKRHVVSTLISNVLLRPKVLTAVGDPIDVRTMVTNVDDPDPNEIRQATDRVMEQLVKLVEVLRDEVAPDSVGLKRVHPPSGGAAHD